MTDILLIEPPIFGSKFGVMRQIASIGRFKSLVKYPPLDLMIIGGLLRKNGIGFKIIDSINMKHTKQDIKKIIENEKPKCVAFTTTVPTLDNDVSIADICKSVDKNIKTIQVNMATESASFNLLERYPNLDFVPYRDPEMPILKLIQNDYDGSKVPGIYWRDNGEIRKNEGGICADINQFGTPAHDMVPLKMYEDYLSKKKPMTMTICSRGCKNQCYHCMTRYLNPLRHRTIESMEEEFNFLKGLGVKEIKFLDCELPFGDTEEILNWARELFNMMIRNKYNFSWFCNGRADCLPLDILKLMKEAGCHTVCLGADSNTQEVLDSMGKNEKVEDIEQAAVNIKKLGMRLMTFVTLGHPKESKESIKKTADWIIHKINPDITSFSLAVPIRGTVFYNYLKKNNFMKDVPEGEEWDASKPPVYDYPNLSSDEMYRLAVQSYRRFYLRPTFVWKRMKNWRKLWFDFKSFIYFLDLYFLESLRAKNK